MRTSRATRERPRIAAEIARMLAVWMTAVAGEIDETWIDGIIYARISKDRTGAGLGVIQQVKECLELARRLHIRVIAIRFDNDKSAYHHIDGRNFSKPRPDYDGLLDDLRAARTGIVLCWHTDRLHRDNTELEDYIKVCGEDDGIPTHTVIDGELNLTTPDGRMIARIKGAVAVREVEQMIRRQKSTKQDRREAGAWGGGPRPFGFSPRKSVKQRGDGGLDHVPAESEAIRKACRTVLQMDPKQGMHTIAREWNAAGFRTPVSGSRGGIPWQPHFVRRTLLAPRNAGLIEHEEPVIKDGKPVIKDGKRVTQVKLYTGNWEPIVDADTWRAVCVILLDPARRTTPGPEPAHLLTGVLVCGVCGGTKFRVHKHRSGPKGREYQCRSLAHLPEDERGGLAITHLTRQAGALEEYISEIVEERLRRPDVVAAAAAQPDIDITALQARLKGIEGELEEWATASGITLAQCQAHSAPLLLEQAGIRHQLDELFRESPLDGREQDESPADYWIRLGKNGDVIRRRAIVAMLMRVRLLPAGRGAPKGLKPGSPRGFREDLVEILPPLED
jgi:DNA invertase Pin-like site-specific DNA recombinase